MKGTLSMKICILVTMLQKSPNLHNGPLLPWQAHRHQSNFVVRTCSYSGLVKGIIDIHGWKGCAKKKLFHLVRTLLWGLGYVRALKHNLLLKHNFFWLESFYWHLIDDLYVSKFKKTLTLRKKSDHGYFVATAYYHTRYFGPLSEKNGWTFFFQIT